MPSPRSAEFDDLLRRHLAPTAEPLDPTRPLVELGLDSIGTVRLVMELEEMLGVLIPNELMVPETFATVNRLWSAVSGLLAAK